MLRVGLQNWLRILPSRFVAVAVRDVPEAVEQYAAIRPPILAITSVDGAETSTPYFRNLVAAPPCRLLVLVNPPADFAPVRVVVASNRFGNHSDGDVSLANQLVGTVSGTHVTFLQIVAPGTSEEDREDGEKRLKERVSDESGRLQLGGGDHPGAVVRGGRS